MQYECRLAYSNYISSLINPETSNKKFWSFIKSQHQECTGIPPLYVDENIIDDDLKKPIATLNNHFASVFTRENTSILPTFSGIPFPEIIILNLLYRGHD